MKSATGIYHEPGVEHRYFGGLRAGQALRIINDEKREGYVHVQPLDEKGEPSGGDGWVYAGILKHPNADNADAQALFAGWVAGTADLPQPGRHKCGRALRQALGLGHLADHAKDFGPPLVRNGWTLRGAEEDYQEGDIVIYGGKHGHYAGGGSGHVGFAVMYNGKMMLWSYTTFGGGATKWQLTPIYQPDYALWR